MMEFEILLNSLFIELLLALNLIKLLYKQESITRPYRSALYLFCSVMRIRTLMKATDLISKFNYIFSLLFFLLIYL